MTAGRPGSFTKWSPGYALKAAVPYARIPHTGSPGTREHRRRQVTHTCKFPLLHVGRKAPPAVIDGSTDNSIIGGVAAYNVSHFRWNDSVAGDQGFGGLPRSRSSSDFWLFGEFQIEGQQLCQDFILGREPVCAEYGSIQLFVEVS